MTVMERLKGRIWGISLLASIVLLLAVWNVDATQTGAVGEDNAVVPHEHNHSDGWMSWEEAVDQQKIMIYNGTSAVVKQNVKVYFTQYLSAISSIAVQTDDFQLCLNGFNYTIDSASENFITEYSGTVANIGVYNCKTTGEISKPQDTTGSVYLFKLQNGSNLTMSGVKLEAVTNNSGEIIRCYGGDVTITNSSLVSVPVSASSYKTADIVYVTKNSDAENPNKVTIINSYLQN